MVIDTNNEEQYYNKNILFISPHFDDAVLSCGSLIDKFIKNTNEVMVVTICGGQPKKHKLSKIAQKLHNSWNFSNGTDIIKYRKQEDTNALNFLGAKSIHLPICDAIYRTDQNGELLYNYDNFESILNYELNKNDISPQKIVFLLEQKININNFSTIYVPLGAGGHVDHILSRYVGQYLLLKKRKRVIFFSDFYAIKQAPLKVALQLDNTNFFEIYEKIHKNNIKAHIIAAKKYQSQLIELKRFYKTNIETCIFELHINSQNSNYFLKLWNPCLLV